jgi:hypothetical protein
MIDFLLTIDFTIYNRLKKSIEIILLLITTFIKI